MLVTQLVITNYLQKNKGSAKAGVGYFYKDDPLLNTQAKSKNNRLKINMHLTCFKMLRNLYPKLYS